MKWIVLGVFAALPLQWFAFGHTPLGVARLHQIAILVFMVVVYARYRLKAHTPVLRVASGFLAANLMLLASWAAADIYHGHKPMGAVQEILYLAAFVAIGTFFYRVAATEDPRLVAALRWAAPVACVSLLLGFAVSMAVNGVNPAVVMSEAIKTANPELFQKQVFKSSFASFGLDAATVEGNLRHEIFGSVLFAMTVSTWAMRVGRATTQPQRIAFRLAMVVGTILLAISLSRSVLIAALLWPVLALGRSLALGRLSPRQLGIAFGGVAGIGVLMASGFGLVIWNRFTTDTTGYGAREQNYVGAFANLREHWLVGGVTTSGVDASSHNFVVDNWLRGGILTGLAAATALVLVALTAARLAVHLPSEPDWMVPVAAAIALPLVRMLTAGGGLIPPVEWVALAFVAGVLAMRRQRDSAAPVRTPELVSASG